MYYHFCRAQLKEWIRSCAIHRYYCNYFPVKLVKTTDLDPNKSYLFCNFPHGIICLGVHGAFGTDAAGFKELFPGIDINVVVLDQNFKIPFFRDYCRVNSTYHSENFVQSFLILIARKLSAYTCWDLFCLANQYNIIIQLKWTILKTYSRKTKPASWIFLNM